MQIVGKASMLRDEGWFGVGGNCLRTTLGGTCDGIGGHERGSPDKKRKKLIENK